MTTCVPKFYCTRSEAGRPPASFAKYYVKSQGIAQGIYTALEIVPSEHNMIIPTKVLTYADAQTKWEDICVALHKHGETETAPSSPTKQGSQPEPVFVTPRRGPRLDASFVSTPATPSSPSKNPSFSSSATNNLFSPNDSPSPSPKKNRYQLRAEPTSTSSSSSSRSPCAPYFLYSSGIYRTVFSSADKALSTYDREVEAGMDCVLNPCWDRFVAHAFLCGKDVDLTI